MRGTRESQTPTIPACLGALWLLLAVAGCSSLPSLDDRASSSALNAEQAQATALGQAVQSRVAAHPGMSGLDPLDDALAAFAGRMLLARHAERTIDVQYYIWQGDITGTLLLAELERAAQRGVRVRLLVDDNGIRGLDDTLAALDAQPNFEVRLFNPFTFRSPKWANYITDFARLNHRMHNKSFTVDNQATIVGGRNIGDIYFAAADDIIYADLDVLGIGPVVADVSKEFDDYWASEVAYPIDRIVSEPADDALARFHARESKLMDDPAARAYRQSLEEDRAVEYLMDEEIALTWAPTRLFADNPAKALGKVGVGERMIDELAPVFDNATESLDLVSPYLVPAKGGTEILVSLARRGVDVRVLTNSLAATDVTAVHAGYVKRRKKLLKAGVKLYEFPRTAAQTDDSDLAGPFGSSGSSLHAKTFAVDGQRLFIGSFNFDPRSANLNTEMGFLIEDPALASAMHQAFLDDIPGRVYQVFLDDDGALYWLRRKDGEVERYTTEPDSALSRRIMVRFLSYLPIDWLL